MDEVLEKLKNIINKTIDREYGNVTENYSEHLKKSPELMKDEKECSERVENLLKKLYKVVPKEHHHLIDEFDTAITEGMVVEARVAFKEGVILGATELSYLGEVGVGLRFI